MQSKENLNEHRYDEESSPPIFKNWFSWYTIVLALLLIELIVLFIIAKVF